MSAPHTIGWTICHINFLKNCVCLNKTENKRKIDMGSSVHLKQVAIKSNLGSDRLNRVSIGRQINLFIT